MALRKVLLVGWDAADWKVIQPLMDAGKMPHVKQLVANGASGSIATLYPPLSPMLWTSIATGKRPIQHGIHGFAEPAPNGGGVRPVTNLSRKSKALWNILNQNAKRSVVTGWWPSHPAEPIDGVMVSDLFHRAVGPLHEGWPLPANAVHPPELTHIVAKLRVHPDTLEPRDVEPFIPLAREIDQERDPRMAALLRTLAECLSIQAAAVWLLENQAWDFFAVYYESLDHFCHSFMRYHPPRQSWIGQRDFDLYHNVVAMAYQLHDQMLGTLLHKAGPDTTVVLMSDHGFHPDHLRPASIPNIPAGPAVEHRDLGILAIQGPGIRRGESLHGASVLDVTPTILTMYGLPVGQDMDGKVLSQAFLEAPDITTIPSWEAVAGPDGRHPPHTRTDPAAAIAALDQIIALGYIEPLDDDRQTAIHRTIHDLRYNLAEAYQDCGRHREAYEIFRELYEADPDEQRFAVRLFVSCQALGRQEEMRRIISHLEPFQPMLVDYLKAQVLIAEKRYSEALEPLERVTEAHTARPEAFLETADLYLRLGRKLDAQQAYERALALDADNPAASLGLCRLALYRRDFVAASQAALRAVERSYHDPLAHFLLGRALAGMGEFAGAAEAFRAAISLNPNFPEAHVRLALVLEGPLGDVESAKEHRRLARRMRNHSDRATECAAALGTRANQPAAPSAVIRVRTVEMTPASDCLTVVTGLPRSGTSMIMQMLAAGGASILSDEVRGADEDNPRGYFEFASVKDVFKESKWLFDARGKAIKIVIPLVTALPAGLACRVILCDRDLDEVLDSQERMLARRRPTLHVSTSRREALKDEYRRSVAQVEAMLVGRASTQLLVIEHRAAISEPISTARRINEFLGGGLDERKMAAAIEPALHRNHRSVPA